jgi:hypothetical protein
LLDAGGIDEAALLYEPDASMKKLLAETADRAARYIAEIAIGGSRRCLPMLPDWRH